ncbi:MAG: RagB/SusD family nutrient uptake outer membrane protein, partial [Bacteroidales bacterium]
MKHIIKNIITGIIAVSAIPSCNSFLDTEPYSSISDTKAITNYSSAFYALTGTYNTMQSTSYYGRDFIVFGDAATENVIISPNNSNRFIAEAQWSISSTSGDMLSFWSQAYEAIYQANKILLAVDNIDATDVQKAALKGQALTIRAMTHFNLVSFFAQSYSGNSSLLGVPYMKTCNNYDKPARNTIQEVYDFIIADLNDAITNFNIAGGSINGNTAPYFISSWAAKGILARVYMAQQNYTAASPILLDIIKNSGYSLLTADKYIDA